MSATNQSRYLDYLPGIFQEDPFLGSFLLPFEKVLTGIEYVLAHIDRYVDPARTDPDFLPWLAGWVALALDEEWDEEKRRQLIAEAVELYRWRGTVHGLKRYLEIYTGLAPAIRENRWPGGMQIGVASRIGGPDPAAANDRTPLVSDDGYPARIEAVTEPAEVASYSWYVVAAAGVADAGGNHPRCILHRVDRVKSVEVGAASVVIVRHDDPTPLRYEPATVTRRDGLADNSYALTLLPAGGPEASVEYQGDGFLIDEIELPYRFLVDVQVARQEIRSVRLDKVRAIVDLEKPAHTSYYLRLTPVVSEFILNPMQVGIRSTIGRDTTAG